MKYRRCVHRIRGGARCWNPAMVALREDERPLCWPHYAKELVDDSLSHRPPADFEPAYRPKFKLIPKPARGQFR